MRKATVIHFNSIVALPFSTCYKKNKNNKYKSGEMTAHAEFRELKSQIFFHFYFPFCDRILSWF